jgi:hypothetical protein
MAYRLTYRLPEVSAKAAKESLAFRRLLNQVPDGEDGTWVCWEHPEGGTIAVWPGSSSCPPIIDELGQGIPCDDGLTFYPNQESPDLVQCLRSEISRPRDGAWVKISTGAELWIAVATLSEVRYSLLTTGSRRRIPTQHAYGILARDLYALYQQREPEPDVDAIVQLETRLVLAAIHQSYQITDEAIAAAELFQMTAVDIEMIVYVALGHDPKEFAAVLRASRSLQPAAELLTCPFLPLSGGPLPDGLSTTAMDHG